MQEEVTQKTIALVFKSSRLTADVLKKAMKMYLERRKAGQQATHGKMSVKKLVGQGMGASSIEVTDNNIKSFERVTRKYNVDFAVKKDKTVEPPKYMVFFKGKDADVITQAFKEFVKVNEFCFSAVDGGMAAAADLSFPHMKKGCLLSPFQKIGTAGISPCPLFQTYSKSILTFSLFLFQPRSG